MAEPKTITIVIDNDIDRELEQIAAITGQSKTDLVPDAVIEWLKDQEDIRDAEVLIAQNNSSFTLAEVKQNLAFDG